MSFSPFRMIRRAAGFIWRVLDACRRISLNLLFLFVVVALLVLFFGGGGKLDDKTALLLDFKGKLVEQHSGGVRDVVLAGGSVDKTTQLRDVILVLRAAAKDPRISSVVLLLDDFSGAGLPMLREVGAELDRFKASGKPVIAWGSSYDQRQYFLAAHANKVLMHPMGIVVLDGFGRRRNYYRDALDKLGITVNLMRVGTYKSFAEPFIANGPSPEAAEAESFLYNAMWATYTDDVEKARKLSAGSLMRDINDLPRLLAAAGGDTGKLVLSARLVDGLKTRDELRQMLIAQGAEDKKSKSFRQVSFDEYLSRLKPETKGNAIGVVIAEGAISDGNVPVGAVGGLSTANLIRKARDDDQIKAVVLRVNSPGGSAFGSELIRRELELTRAAGKPVVVSMGDVAASGGYWISMAADEVIADTSTITGSIGVFAILPTAEKLMDKIGVHTAGTATTWLGGAYDPRRPIDPRFAALIQTGIDHIYDDFVTKAAHARKTTPQKIDEVAQGRVWTGQQAKERGLIDTVGSYGDALKSAATRAKLGADYRVTYIEPERSRFERLFNLIDASAVQVLNEHLQVGLVPTGMAYASAREITKELGWLGELTNGRKNFMAMTHCLCGEP